MVSVVQLLAVALIFAVFLPEYILDLESDSQSHTFTCIFPADLLARLTSARQTMTTAKVVLRHVK